jgi:hypothetical protein
VQQTQVAVGVLLPHRVLHLGVLAGVFQVEGDVGVELGVQPLDTVGDGIDHLDRRHLAGTDLGGEIDGGDVAEVGFRHWQLLHRADDIQERPHHAGVFTGWRRSATNPP